MPLYEYECTACLKHTEKIQKFSDPEITICPHCGGTLKRVITAPAIAFKGGGWYADGYGNQKPAAAGESKGGEDKTSDGKGGGKSSDGKSSDSKADGTASPAAESKPSGGSESSAAPAAAATTAPSAPASSPASDKK